MKSEAVLSFPTQKYIVFHLAYILLWGEFSGLSINGMKSNLSPPGIHEYFSFLELVLTCVFPFTSGLYCPALMKAGIALR